MSSSGQKSGIRRRKPHSVSDAVRWLDSLLPEYATAGRLPPVRVLCRQYGFSPVTLHKALRILQQRGLCVVVPRGAVIIATGGVDRRAAAPVISGYDNSISDTPLRSWQYAKRQLSEDLFAGRLAAGEHLPTIKELRTRLGVGHSALLRALAELAREGRIRREGRGWRICSVGRAAAGSVLVFVGHGDTLAELYEYTPRSAEYFRTIERLCHDRRLRMEYVSYRDVVLWRGRGPEFLSSDVRHPVVGSLVWTLGLYPQDIEPLTTRLVESGRPSAVLDEGGTLAIPQRLLASRTVQAFTMGTSELCGILIGRYLVAHGHRRIIFFGYSKNDRAIENRARGVQRALEETMADTRLYVVHVSELIGEEAWAEVHRCSGRAARFARLVADAEKVLGTAQTNPLRWRFSLEARALARAECVREFLWPKLYEALTFEGVTAWVAANDPLAFVLLDFLREAGIDVPKVISVVGFDDTPGAFTSGLTSYNFNSGLVAQRMLEHILSPASSRWGRSPDWIEIPGFVVERTSSGRAPR